MNQVGKRLQRGKIKEQIQIIKCFRIINVAMVCMCNSSVVLGYYQSKMSDYRNWLSIIGDMLYSLGYDFLLSGGPE